MTTKRRLVLETLETRLMLDSAGLGADPAQEAWQQVIVSLTDDVTNPSEVAQGLVNSHGGQLGHVYQHALKGFSASMPAGAVAGLRNNPNVKLVEPDLVMHSLGQTLPTGVDRIDGELNAIANIDGKDERVDVDIAIIDTGIDMDHPDLNVVNGRRFYIPTTGRPSSRVLTEDGNYDDDNGHGTHVAGTAAALDNDIGVVGVAPGARLWGVKVLDANGSGYLSAIIAGIDWVTENANEIEVANMSLGGQGVSSAYQEAIQGSVDAGVVYMVAAGNEWSNIYGSDNEYGTNDDFIPASYPEVAAISAFADSNGQPGGGGGSTSWGDNGQDDAWWRPSNFSKTPVGAPGLIVNSPGMGIDLVMPGVDILSTYPGGGYATGSGTSMASPHAAGLAALYIAANGRANDADGVSDIRQALIDGGVAWHDSAFGLVDPADGFYIGGSPDPNFENLGWAGNVVASVPTVSITSPTDGSTVSGLVNVTADASAVEGAAVTQVEFFVDGESIGDAVTADPYTVSWNTTSVMIDGSYAITATVTDDFGKMATSSTVTVNVDNIDDLPIVDIRNPADGSTVSGLVNVTADASDDQDVGQVQFFVVVDGDDVRIGDAVTAAPYAVSWDTTSVSDDSYTILATVTDSGGQTTTDTVTVTVDNSAPSPGGMHVTDLDGWATSNKNQWRANVAVHVVDDAGTLADGALVSGLWSDGSSGVASVTTVNGIATFQSNFVGKKTGSITFTVDNIMLDGSTYDDTLNADPESDSNGTVIVVAKADITQASGAAMAAEMQWLYSSEMLHGNQRSSVAKNRLEDAVDYLMMYEI